MSDVIVTLVHSEEYDWEVLYVDGQLKEEGHTLPAFRVVEASVGLTISSFLEAESSFDAGGGKGTPLLSQLDDLTPAQ